MQHTMMEVHLGNEQGLSTVLKYNIRDTEAAQIWAQCIAQDVSNGFREDDRFYNFPNQSRSNIDFLCQELEALTLKIQSFHPDLIFPRLDKLNLQQSINHLHINFAHGHHVTMHINHENEFYWNRFNILLHEIESVMINEKTSQYLTNSLSRIVFTFKNKKTIPIPENSYKDFSIGIDFGVAYVNYCQVGRHFLEMFDANDDQLADEHILPLRSISADTLLWFGPSLGSFYVSNKMNKMKEWFEQRKDRFNALGFFWNDPKLALGRIPVARLNEQIYTAAEIKRFTERLSVFNKVIHVSVS